MLMKRSLAKTSSFLTSSPWTLVVPAIPYLHVRVDALCHGVCVSDTSR